MEIRRSTEKDFEQIMEIYRYAREFMAKTGNPNQWGPTNWPPEQLIHSDISSGTSYVCVHEEKIVGTFFYTYGENAEPGYERIEEGNWLNNDAYGVVHRIAGNGSVKGIGKFCLEWAYQQCGHLRIDTHADNKPMQHVVEKAGFSKRGIIYVADGTPRIAYDRI